MGDKVLKRFSAGLAVALAGLLTLSGCATERTTLQLLNRYWPVVEEFKKDFEQSYPGIEWNQRERPRSRKADFYGCEIYLWASSTKTDFPHPLPAKSAEEQDWQRQLVAALQETAAKNGFTNSQLGATTVNRLLLTATDADSATLDVVFGGGIRIEISTMSAEACKNS